VDDDDLGNRVVGGSVSSVSYNSVPEVYAFLGYKTSGMDMADPN
jgi:hypothetical protein